MRSERVAGLSAPPSVLELSRRALCSTLLPTVPLVPLVLCSARSFTPLLSHVRRVDDRGGGEPRGRHDGPSLLSHDQRRGVRVQRESQKVSRHSSTQHTLTDSSTAMDHSLTHAVAPSFLRYHRSYGLVTPPTNPAFVDYRLGDLATAPLYRRDHLGFRVEYPDAPFSWTASSEKLKKNQKTYGSEGLQRSEAPNLPRRTVQWQGSAAYPDTARQREFEAEQQDRAWAESQAQEAEFQRRFADRQAWERSNAAAARTGPESQLTRNGRAILTSSMSPGRLAAASSPPANLSATQQQIELDHRNPNRYPVEAFKTSKFNPQFDPTDKRTLRAE